MEKSESNKKRNEVCRFLICTPCFCESYNGHEDLVFRECFWPMSNFDICRSQSALFLVKVMTGSCKDKEANKTKTSLCFHL